MSNAPILPVADYQRAADHSALRVVGLSRDYVTPAGTVQALHDVSLAIQAGHSLAVTGPSGSGKSTLLGLVAGLDRPSAGRVFIAGTDLTTCSENALATLRSTRIGYVFQHFRLLPGLTALENVALPLALAGTLQPAEADARARAWLDRVGLAARADHVPSRLSGGEQQRVALARALVSQPAVILADEPTGNLDPKTAAVTIKLLLDQAKNFSSTLIIVTHNPAIGEQTDRILVLRNGHLEEQRSIAIALASEVAA